MQLITIVSVCLQDCLHQFHVEAENYGIGKQKTKQIFAQKALASFVLFQSPPGHEKKRDFRTQHLTAATSHRLAGHGS